MSDPNRRRLALLARAPNLTASQLRALAAADPSLGLVERATAAGLAPFGLTTSTREWLLAPDRARLDLDEAWLDSAGAVLWPAPSPSFPPLLALLPDAPAVLYVRGDVATLSEPQLAMVG